MWHVSVLLTLATPVVMLLDFGSFSFSSVCVFVTLVTFPTAYKTEVWSISHFRLTVCWREGRLHTYNNTLPNNNTLLNNNTLPNNNTLLNNNTLPTATHSPTTTHFQQRHTLDNNTLPTATHSSTTTHFQLPHTPQQPHVQAWYRVCMTTNDSMTSNFQLLLEEMICHVGSEQRCREQLRLQIQI